MEADFDENKSMLKGLNLDIKTGKDDLDKIK